MSYSLGLTEDLCARTFFAVVAAVGSCSAITVPVTAVVVAVVHGKSCGTASGSGQQRGRCGIVIADQADDIT